jgi:hypothetical protein
MAPLILVSVRAGPVVPLICRGLGVTVDSSVRTHVRRGRAVILGIALPSVHTWLRYITASKRTWLRHLCTRGLGFPVI